MHDTTEPQKPLIKPDDEDSVKDQDVSVKSTSPNLPLEGKIDLWLLMNAFNLHENYNC